LLVLDILKTEKSHVRDRFISYSKYSRRGTLFIQNKVGSALTETKNWDLLVDCTSRDGRQMLDAGVHLSDKRTLLMKTHMYRFKHSTKYSTESDSTFTNGEETTDSIISKMLSNLSCLVFDRSSVMKTIKYSF
jgi:hypothetical protein